MAEIKLINTDLVALVDDEDYSSVVRHTWYLFKYARSNYAKAQIDGAWIGMHQFVKPSPPGLITDHKNHNGLDNQKENLRIATFQQNRQNIQKHADGKSRYKGVSWNKEKRKWVAQICIDGRQTNLGRYYSERTAAMVYNEAAKKHYGEFANLNILEETESVQ